MLWSADDTASFSATTVAGGMMFSGLALAAKAIQVHDVASGRLLAQVALGQFNWSGIATVGDALVFWHGMDLVRGTSSGIEVLTPGGAPPVVPGGG